MARGELPLYGTGSGSAPKTRQVLPPAIASTEVTNAARLAIGLPQLEAYRDVDRYADRRALCCATAGSRTLNVDPSPGTEVTESMPPCRSTTRWQMARPMPVPG